MRLLFALILICFIIKTNAQWTGNTTTIHPTDITYGCVVLPNNLVYVSGTEGSFDQPFRSSISKSSNNGITFSDVYGLTNASLGRIKFWDNNKGIALNNYISDSRIVKTTDGGQSWASTILNLPTGYNGNVKDISFLDSVTYYLTSGNKIFKDINFSSTPIEVNAPSNIGNIDEVQFFTSNFGFCSVGHLYKTINGGISWNNITSNFGTNLKSFKFFDANKGIILFDDGSIYKTTNGGIVWTNVRSGSISTTGYFNQLFFVNPYLGFAVAQHAIIVTTDGGQTWSTSQTFGANFSLTNLFMNSNGIGIATGLTFGNYAYTTNFGGATVNTNIASVTIGGADSVCMGSSGTIRFDFTGSGPWTVTYNDGTTSNTLNNLTTTPYFVPITVFGNKTYSITSFKNNNVASSNIFGSAFTKIITSNQSATISGNKTICGNDSALITIRLQGSKPVTFTYTNGVTPVTISGYTDTVYKFYAKPVQTTTYTLTSIQDVCNTNGTVSGSAVVTYISAPIAPGNFTLADSNKRVQLTWTDNANNEDSIIVERSINNSTNFVRIKSVPANTTQYLDTTNLQYDTWYFYRLKYIKNGISCITYSSLDSIYLKFQLRLFDVTSINDFGFSNIKNAAWFDVDIDGDQDIIFGNMIVYENRGDGTFRYAYRDTTITLNSTYGSTLKVADVDNNGKVDCILLNITQAANSVFYTYTNNGNFLFTKSNNFIQDYKAVTPYSNNTLDFNTLDSNMQLDIMQTFQKTYSCTETGLKQFFYGSNTPSIYVIYPNTMTFNAFATDFNSDNKFDFLANDLSGVRLVTTAINGFYTPCSNPFYGMFNKYNNLTHNTNTSAFGNMICYDLDNDNKKELIEFRIDATQNPTMQKFDRQTNNFILLSGAHGDYQSKVTGATNIAVEDFDNNGWPDIFVYNYNKPSYLLYQTSPLVFTSSELGTLPISLAKGNAVALADYDKDGKVDVFIPSVLLKNKISNTNNWINIKPEGITLNKTPFGTTVKIKVTNSSGTYWQTREISSYGSLYTQNNPIAHFGLGNATQIDSIAIYWPNGQTSFYSNVSNNQNITYYEPSTSIIRLASSNSTITENTLTWNPITGTTQYKLLRKKTGTLNYTTVYTGLNQSFEDTSLMPNTAYQYKILAIRPTDTLRDSLITTTLTLVLNVTPNTNKTAGLSWQISKSHLIKYRIFRTTNVILPYNLIKIVNATNTTRDTLLTQNANYCYYVQAYYAADSNTVSNSNVVCVTIPPMAVLSAGRDTTVCSGQAVTITATGASSYSWNTGQTTASITVSPTTTTSYIVTGIVDGISQKDTVFVNIHPTKSTNRSQTICQGQTYAFNGMNLSTAGTYRDTLQQVNGCDSFIVLTLNVNPAKTTNRTQTICQGQTYSFNGMNLSTAGTYRDTLQQVNGCDSFIVLTLNVNPSKTTNITQTIQSGQTYPFNGMNLTTSGTYRDTLLQTNGCDSFIVLTLTVITGIKNTISFLDHIAVFPNPAEDFISIELNSKKPTDFQLEIIGIDGKLYWQKTYYSTRIIQDKISLSDLAKGMYFMKIRADDEQVTYKIIKK